MLTGAVAKQITSNMKEKLLLHRWNGLATDGSSDEDDKFLLVLVRHVDKDSGLVATSLLEMSNNNSGSTAQQMYDVCNKVREAFSLDWDNFVVYSSDNTNSMIGQHNSFLQEIRSAQGGQKVFDLVCPCHLAHMCAGKGAKEFSVNVKELFIDKYYLFCRSEKQKNQLREFITFNNNEVRKVINHVSSRWLSIGSV